MTIRIGTGAGFSGDRIGPAIDLALYGDLDYLVFECLAERTIAKAQLNRVNGQSAGFDSLLSKRIHAVLEICARRNTSIITNMGAANPLAAARLVREIANQCGLDQIRIAVVSGDDVLSYVKTTDKYLSEINRDASELEETLVSANAYLGVRPIVEALSKGADVVITGRVADPAMFMAPMIHEFGWDYDGWARLGQGAVVGHLMECGAQVTGGYFCDPGIKDVPNLAHVGFPIAEVEPTGDAIITKIDGSGGVVSEATCKEQLLYEIHDPASYAQPDVIADFSNVSIEHRGRDRVHVSGGSGREKSGYLKTSIGYFDSWIGEGQISYAGANAYERACAALGIVKERVLAANPHILEIKCDLIGVNSVHGNRRSAYLESIPEVRARFAARTTTRDEAIDVEQEVESLYLNGPAGGGGVITSLRQILAVTSTLIPESAAQISVELL